MGKTTQVLTRPVRKRTTKKGTPASSTCPANAVGWCSYPFTIAQLEKKLKQSNTKAEARDHKN